MLAGQCRIVCYIFEVLLLLTITIINLKFCPQDSLSLDSRCTRGISDSNLPWTYETEIYFYTGFCRL